MSVKRSYITAVGHFVKYTCLVLVKFIHENIILSTWDVNQIKVKTSIFLFTYNAIKIDFVNLVNKVSPAYRQETWRGSTRV